MAVGVQALVDLEAALVGGQGGRAPLAQTIEMGSILAADDEHIAEAGRAEQRRGRSFALQQRVGGDRHAVNNGEGRGARGEGRLAIDN